MKAVARLLCPHLFSGPCRREDLGWWLAVLAFQAGIEIRIEAIDTVINERFGLGSSVFFEALMAACLAGLAAGSLTGWLAAGWMAVWAGLAGPGRLG